MSLFGTFAILFEADTTPLDKGLDDVKKSAKGVEENLGGIEKTTQAAGSKMLDLAKGFGAVAASFISIAAARAAINTFVDGAGAVGQFSNALGLNVEEVGAWGAAVQANGGSADSFNGTLKGLTEQLFQVKRFGWSEFAQDLSFLGIKAKDSTGNLKTATDLLPEIAAKMQNMSAMRAAEVGKKLGLDDGTIQLMRKGEAGVRALVEAQKELGVYTEDDAKKAREYSEATHNMGRAWDGFTAILARAVIPVLNALSRGMTSATKFMREHETMTKILGGVITGVFVVAMYSAATAAWALSAPLIAAAASAALLAAPFIAAGAAAVLLLDDFLAFRRGAESVIGDVVKWVDKLMSTEQTGVFRRGLQDTIKTLIVMKDVFMSIFDIASKVFEFIGKLASVPMLGFEKAFSAKVTGTNMRPEANKQDTYAMVDAAQKQLSYTNTPLAAMSSQSILNSQQKNNRVEIGKIDIHTQATDADGIAKHLGSSLSDQMRNAMSDFGSGVAM